MCGRPLHPIVELNLSCPTVVITSAKSVWCFSKVGYYSWAVWQLNNLMVLSMQDCLWWYIRTYMLCVGEFVLYYITQWDVSGSSLVIFPEPVCCNGKVLSSCGGAHSALLTRSCLPSVSASAVVWFGIISPAIDQICMYSHVSSLWDTVQSPLHSSASPKLQPPFVETTTVALVVDT